MHRFLASLLVLISGFTFAQNPTIKGGLANFINQRVLYPQYSWQHCIQGKVSVSFKLNKKGEVYYTAIIKGIISELDKEAVRLIKLSSKKWAVPSGYDTTSLLVVPVNFIVSGHDCNTTSNSEITFAINNYIKNEQMENSIINFYKALEKGQADKKDESVFTAYKETLGIDNDYLKDRIDIGLKKIKQKDIAGACEEFVFVRYMGSSLADKFLEKYCK